MEGFGRAAGHGGRSRVATASEPDRADDQEHEGRHEGLTTRGRVKRHGGAATRMVREGLLQDPWRPEHGQREGDHQRVPEAREEAPSRREPGRRGDVQGDHRRLRRARRRRQSQGVRRGARHGPCGEHGGLPGRVRRRRDHLPRGGRRRLRRLVRWPVRSRPATRHCDGSAARRGRGDRGAPLLRGRGQRGDHLGQRDDGRPVPYLPRERIGSRHPPDHVPALWGDRHAPRRPGPLLPEPDLPAVWRPRDHHHLAVPDVLGDRRRAPQPVGQGPDPARSRGRTADPGQGPWRGRSRRRPERRPLRGGPRRGGTPSSDGAGTT